MLKNRNMKNVHLQFKSPAKKLAIAVFDVYRTTAKKYERAIGPIIIPEQQKVVLDVALACVGIANKEQRVEKFREERKNGNGNSPQPPKPKVVSETKPAEAVENEPVKPEQKDGVAQADLLKPTTKPPEDEPEKPRKPRDDRNRPTEQLITELNIKSPAQAGWLRARKEISYIEWQRVKDYVSQQQIANGGKLASP